MTCVFVLSAYNSLNRPRSKIEKSSPPPDDLRKCSTNFWPDFGSPAATQVKMTEAQREKALSDYRSKLMEHREMDAKLKKMRADCKALTKQYDKSENDLKALQSVGQIVGEVLRLVQ